MEDNRPLLNVLLVDDYHHRGQETAPEQALTQLILNNLSQAGYDLQTTYSSPTSFSTLLRNGSPMVLNEYEIVLIQVGLEQLQNPLATDFVSRTRHKGQLKPQLQQFLNEIDGFQDRVVLIAPVVTSQHGGKNRLLTWLARRVQWLARQYKFRLLDPVRHLVAAGQYSLADSKRFNEVHHQKLHQDLQLLLSQYLIHHT